MLCSTLAARSSSSIFVSPGVSISSARPAAVCRAVRPVRWMYVATSSGQSTCTTQCTAGKSRPRAATSVANRTACCFWQNCVYIASRFICFCCPCRHSSGTPGRSALIAPCTNFTCSE
jgi:hypothetical protein